MVELTHNGKRYMVDGGQWFRRLDVGEVIPESTQYSSISTEWYGSDCIGDLVLTAMGDDYRVPCTDPRPPFVVGQRVKVARLEDIGVDFSDALRRFLGKECEITEVYEDGSGYATSLDRWSFATWCLDAVTEQHEESDR